MTENKQFKKICYNMDENIHFRAKQLALNKGTTVTDLYNKWIAECLEREEKQE